MTGGALQREDSEVEEFKAEVNLAGRTWIIEGDIEKYDEIYKIFDRLVCDYSGFEQMASILLEGDRRTSWSFGVATEDVEDLSVKFSELEEQEWSA